MAIASKNSMVGALNNKGFNNALIRDFLLVVFASSLLAISAQFKVPLGAVPITLQSMVVMLIGTIFGWRLGAATILAYWAEGIAIGGLFSMMPWFANGSGLVYFFGAPSAGFLWGFLPMVVVIGYLSDSFGWRKNIIKLFFALVCGQICLYVCGLGHAYYVVLPTVDWMSNFSDMIGIYASPFIFGDVVKTLLALLITFRVSKLLTFVFRK